MASYTLFGIDGKPIDHHDLQDKAVWCKDGYKKEEVFVQLHGSSLGLIINPDKITNPYAPDLLNNQTSNLGDLKVQNTPFFKAEKLYSIPPKYAVVFNHKDRVRYNRDYPDIDIYYWVDWLAVGFKMGNNRIDIEPLRGVWKISMKSLESLLKESDLHEYQQRQNDTKGNARSSYVLDIRDSRFQQLI